jgi:putative addiction module antidote
MEVPMNIIVRKIGNSEGIIIPKDVLDRVGVRAGDSLELREEDGKIILVYQDADLAEQLKAARIGMEKYKVALRELAK